jgi:integrase
MLLDRLQENGARSLQVVNGERTLWNLKNVDAYFAGMRVTGINEETISTYRKQRREEGANPATINRELSLLRRMMYYARKRKKFAGEIPDFGMTSEDGAVRRGFLERVDFDRLLAALPEHLHILFLYTVAVRLGEAQRVQWNQIDLRNRTVQLHDTKSGEWRTVPLSPELAVRLMKVPPEQRVGTVFYAGAFRKTWVRACIACGQGGWEIVGETGRKRYRALIVHDLRRSAIRNLPHAVYLRTSSWRLVVTGLSRYSSDTTS